MAASAIAMPVTESRSWVVWRKDQPWRYTVGFDRRGCPVRFEMTGNAMAGGRARLALAWHTVDGTWLGRYRGGDGYVTAALSPTEIALIESTATAIPA